MMASNESAPPPPFRWPNAEPLVRERGHERDEPAGGGADEEDRERERRVHVVVIVIECPRSIIMQLSP